MTSRIDRIRRSSVLGRSPQTEATGPDETYDAKVVNLPVPVGRAAPKNADQDATAAFAAQLMGQDGQKRGLRAGPNAIQSAQGAYNKVEWSGSKDRRGRPGRNKTEV